MKRNKMPRKAKRTEADFGKGAKPLLKDLRDRKYSKLGMAPIPFNWAKGFDANKGKVYPVKDQNGSGSCGGQSGSYLMQNLCQGKELSAKNIYSQIFYKGSGTTLRDILKHATTVGICEESLVVSYNQGNPPSEGFMQDKTANTPITVADAFKHQGLSYAFVKPDIDTYAMAIRDNSGAIMQLFGMNNGTWLSEYPAPATRKEWSHFVFCDGAFLINGKKHLRIRNSWGTSAGDKGHQYISEDHFKAGMVQTGGVIYNPQDANDLAEAKKAWTIRALQQLISWYQQLLKQTPV